MSFNQPPSNSGPFTRENEPVAGKAGLTGEQTPAGKASPKLNQSGNKPASDTTGKADDSEAPAEPVKMLREYGSNVAAAQRDRVVSEVGTLSNAARETAKRLRAENDNNIAGYIESVADRIDGAADYLRNASAGELIGDVQSVARRHPELVVGGMFVTGLLIARFLKAGTKEAVRTVANEWSDEDSDVDDDGYSDERLGTPTARYSGSAIDESGYVGEGTVESGNYGGGSTASAIKKSGDKSATPTKRSEV